MQGTDDLEEAMNERLQELPPPLGRRNSHFRHDDDGFSFPQDMDTDAAGPSRVRHACLALLSSMQASSCSMQAHEVRLQTTGHLRALPESCIRVGMACRL